MLRKLFIVTFVSAVALLALHLLWTPRSAQTLAAQLVGTPPQPRAFTATRSDATFLPSSGVPIRTEMRTIAIRSDGSRAELWHRTDPSGSGNVLYLKRITDVPGSRRVVVEPLGESLTTYPLPEEAIRFHAAKPLAECEGEAAGQLLGYPVTLAETTKGPEQLGAMLDQIRIQVWLAPGLDCFPLRREITFIRGERETQLTIESVVAVTEGEPEASLFEVPSNYVERAPSDAMAEAARRYPNVEGLDCSTCSQLPKDEAYFERQREFRQKKK